MDQADLPLTGEYQAPDGWRIDWDLASDLHTIWFYQPSGIAKSHISGIITQKSLARELRAFEQEHGPQQLALF